MVYNKEKDRMKKIICALTLIITVLAGSINTLQSVDIRFSVAVNRILFFSLILMIFILNILKKIFNRK